MVKICFVEFGNYCPMWGCLPFHPYCVIIPPAHPSYPNIPNFPTHPFQWHQLLVRTHFYLCSLTFSVRPDEAASVWRQQKLIFNKLIYCFVSAYHIMDTNKFTNRFNNMDLLWPRNGECNEGYTVIGLTRLIFNSTEFLLCLIDENSSKKYQQIPYTIKQPCHFLLSFFFLHLLLRHSSSSLSAR